MKRLLILVAMLIMLCGATAGAMKWLAIGPFLDVEKPKEAIKAVVPDTTVFLDMEPLAIPIFQGNRIAATVQIQVKLETNSDKNATKIKRVMPLITDAYVRDLHSFLPRLLKAEERIDVLIIKQRLQMISDKVVGKGLVKNVLVQSVIDQPR